MIIEALSLTIFRSLALHPIAYIDAASVTMLVIVFTQKRSSPSGIAYRIISGGIIAMETTVRTLKNTSLKNLPTGRLIILCSIPNLAVRQTNAIAIAHI